MKIIKSVIGSCLFFLFIISLGVQVSSCTKTEIQHDTTVKVVKDTTILYDTVYDLRTGLIAYYNFKNGNLNDSSGLGNNIIFNNAVAAKDRFGNSGSAYQFSGGSYMKVNNSPSLNPSQITLMAIVKFEGFYTGPSYGNEIFMKGFSDQSQGVYGLRAHPQAYGTNVPSDTLVENFVGFYGDNANGGIIAPTTNIQNGAWNIVVYTYDGYTAKIYVNGNLESSKVVPFATYASGYDLYIGKTENPTFPYNFTGVIDEIRIYSKALTPELIKGFNTLTQ
jgi:hypothetical protein